MILAGMALVVAAVLGVALWQHRRYLRVRRSLLCDRQPMLYPGSAFHALTFVKAMPGGSVIDELRTLRRAVDAPGGGLVIYAGQIGMAMVTSEQVSNDWSALLLVQYPSREAYDRFTARDEYRAALARFSDVYTHGVLRRAGLNLMLPQGLLLLRLGDLLRRAPSAFPFVPVGDGVNPRLEAKMKEVAQLDSLRPYGEDAVVIVNLIKPGNAEQRTADRSYARAMLRAMAEGGYGPMHMGRAVTLEGEADFEQVVAVYYPGIAFVQKMIGSTFMNRIGAGKQLGDSLAVVTVPILAQL